MNTCNFNMPANNLMNNMYFNNNMNMNMNMNMTNNFQNNFNVMNNNFNMYNNNFNMYNNNFNNNLNNIYYNNMMMNMNMNMNMMYNQYLYQNQQIAQMKNLLLKKKMEKILNQQNNKNYKNDKNDDIDNNNCINNNFIEQQQDEIEDNKALFEVSKELELQKQRFEQYPIPNNIDCSEVDPEFMHIFISDKTLFCGSGHNLEGKWTHGENRGGRSYNPPDGWIGFGLNVLNKYDNGNNDWLACDGRPGEWCIA